jgi:hypothetical protein
MTYKRIDHGRVAVKPREELGALAYMQRLSIKRELRAAWHHAAPSAQPSTAAGEVDGQSIKRQLFPRMRPRSRKAPLDQSSALIATKPNR